MRTICLLLMGLMIGCAAASRMPTDGGDDAGKVGSSGCESDADCPDGFCDTTGECGTVKQMGMFGWPTCTAEKDYPPDVDRETRAKLNLCGAYRCIDGRCRSCRNDLDCFEVTGVVDTASGITCGPVGVGAPMFPDGRRCGRY